MYFNFAQGGKPLHLNLATAILFKSSALITDCIQPIIAKEIDLCTFHNDYGWLTMSNQPTKKHKMFIFVVIFPFCICFSHFLLIPCNYSVFFFSFLCKCVKFQVFFIWIESTRNLQYAFSDFFYDVFLCGAKKVHKIAHLKSILIYVSNQCLIVWSLHGLKSVYSRCI